MTIKKMNKTDMVSNAKMLTKDFTLYDLKKNLPPKSSLKLNFTISYDINVTNDFQNISGNSQTERRSQKKENAKKWRKFVTHL